MSAPKRGVLGDPNLATAEHRAIGRIAGGMLSFALAFVLLACFLLDAEAKAQSPFDVTVDPVFDVNGSGSNIDSIAFWEAPSPADTLMFVTSKGAPLVEVWGYPFDAQSGRPDLVHECIDDGTNGVVVDQVTDRLYVSVRSSANTCVFSLPDLSWLQTINSDAAYHGEPNLGLLHMDSGETRLYVTDDNVIYIHDAHSGSQIDKFVPPREVETIAGDDFYQEIYVPDENGRSGIYRYDPAGSIAAPLFGGGVFDSDEEGIIVYTCPSSGQADDGEGFIVVSDQINTATEFEFFDRMTKVYLGKMQISGVSNTDGVGSTQQSSAAFPLGVFAAIDNDSSAAGLGWDTILEATGLVCPATTEKVALSTVVVGSGTVVLDPGGGLYDVGTVVTLTAAAAQYWEFVGWSGDVAGPTNPISFSMTADSTITATFTVKTDELLYKVYIPDAVRNP